MVSRIYLHGLTPLATWAPSCALELAQGLFEHFSRSILSIVSRYNHSISAYEPKNKEWIKEKVYKHLQRMARGAQ